MNSKAFRWAVILLVWVVVTGLGKVYLLFDEETATSDGYASQVAFIRTLLESGDGPSEMVPLQWIHLLRTAVAVFFDILLSIGGPALVGAVMLAAMFPVMTLFDGSRRMFIGSLMPLSMLVLSYRGVLVLISIGYLLLFLMRNRGGIFLLLSFVLANLSSGAVLTALLISIMIGTQYRRRNVTLKLFIASLAVSLAISALDKYAGFVAGESGYDSTVEGATGLAALLSRSTAFVSILTGDYLRGLIYIGLFFAALFGFIYALNRPRFKGYALIFMTAVPAFLLEGLGVISLIVPVLLLLSGVPLPRRPARPMRRVPRANPTLSQPARHDA